MSRANPNMRKFAEGLVTYEAKTNRAAGSDGPVALIVCDKLHSHLSTLMGRGGYSALLARALVVASGESPWLRGLKIHPDGRIVGLQEIRAQLAPEELAEGGLVLLSQMLALLAAFVGESLTVQLVSDVWPKLPRNPTGSANGDKK